MTNNPQILQAHQIYLQKIGFSNSYQARVYIKETSAPLILDGLDICRIVSEYLKQNAVILERAPRQEYERIKLLTANTNGNE